MLVVAESGTNPTWNLAPTLIRLVDETDRLFPNRSRRSDGSIGDLSHQARPSDHNPKPPSPPGWVDAVDLTDDDEAGADVSVLVRSLIATRDPRVKYLIHNGEITRSYASGTVPAWASVPYTGPSPHRSHLHVSVTESQRHSKAEWWTVAPAPSPLPPEEDEMYLVVKCKGQPTRLLAAPLFPVISASFEGSLRLRGHEAVYCTEEDYRRILDHVERSFGEK